MNKFITKSKMRCDCEMSKLITDIHKVLALKIMPGFNRAKESRAERIKKLMKSTEENEDDDFISN